MCSVQRRAAAVGDNYESRHYQDVPGYTKNARENRNYHSMGTKRSVYASESQQPETEQNLSIERFKFS